MLEYYKQYMKMTRNVSESTINHYVTAINTINTLLSKYDYPIKNVFNTLNIQELSSVKEFLLNNEEFLKKDSTGNRMYSTALKHFYRFADEGFESYKIEIDKMDMVLPKPKERETHSVFYQRNEIIKSQVIKAAKYKCECNEEHRTFISASTGKPFMEGHHLIPLRFQSEFNVSIDIYANIVCICPVCHKLLHYGLKNEKLYEADKLFESRKDRLIKSGINISKNEFRKFIA